MAAIVASVPAPAAATQQKRVRPGRSSSLQRMLDLEKQAMLDRQQRQGQVSPTSPQSAPMPAASSKPPRTAQSKNTIRKPLNKPSRAPKSAPSHLPPIEVNFGPTPNTALQWEKTGLGIQAREDNATSATTTTTTLTPSTPRSADKPSPKSVAFHIPDNKARRNSMCQSPTWEAYGRQKQEKKEELQERKERERQEKEALKSKRGRLSKQPPPPSPSSSKPPVTVMRQPGRNQSDIVVGSRPVPRERPSSVLGLVTGGTSPLEAPPTPGFHQRHRSGSFSSLMRAFDLRRTPSEDSNGFIGGIKLEQERFDAANPYPQASRCEDPEKLPLPAELHPALRDHSAPSSSAAAASPSSEKGQMFSPSHARKRSYPPIAMQTTSKQTRSLLSPEAAASSDLSTIDKWRARVGLKRSQKQQQQQTLAEQNSVPQQASPAMEKPSRIAKPVISGPILNKAPVAVVVDELPRKVPCSPEGLTPTRPKQPVESAQLPRPISTVIPQSTITVQPASPIEPSEFQAPIFFPQSKPSNDGAESILSVPPPPPRRSSKRRSWIAPASNDKNTAARFLVPKKLNLQEQQQPSSSTSSTATLTNSPPLASPVGKLRQMQIQQQQMLSSSEDSGSDYSHSPWAPSTPATSRPQSDTDLTPVLADIEKFFLHDRAESNLDLAAAAKAASLKQKVSTASIASQTAREAADKLLTSIPDIPVRQASVERTEGKAMLDVGFAPQVVHQEVPLPVKSEARNRRSFPLTTRKAVPEPLTASDATPRIFMENMSAMPSPLLTPPKPTTAAVAPPSPILAAAAPPLHGRGVELVDESPVAKVFVECCSCRYYHDMPSRLYEAMSDPEKVLPAEEDKMGFAGALSMTVRCPWCRHEMSTRCCAGLVAMVYVKERLH